MRCKTVRLCSALSDSKSQPCVFRTLTHYVRLLFGAVSTQQQYKCVWLQSGKLALKMFIKAQEYIEDPQALVCDLSDEVGVLHVHSSLH